MPTEKKTVPTDKELQDLYRRAELAGVLDQDKELRDLTNRASAAGLISGISGEERDAYRSGKSSAQLQGSAVNLRRTTNTNLRTVNTNQRSPKLPGVTFRDPQTKKATGRVSPSVGQGDVRSVGQGDVRQADRKDEAFIKSLSSMKGQTPERLRAQDTNAPRFSNKSIGRDIRDMVGAEADALFMYPEAVRLRMAGDSKGAAKVVKQGQRAQGESLTARAFGGALGGTIQKGEGGAASRNFTKGVLPGAGGLAGFSAGARVGATVPGPAPVKALSSLGLGMVGAAGGGAAVAGAQRGLDRFLLGSEGLREIDAQSAIDQRDNPLASSIGQASTALLFGKPTADDIKAIPQIVGMVRGGIPLRVALASPAGKMLSDTLRERAMESGVEVLAAAGENFVTGKKMNWQDTGIQALSGALLPGENRFGRVFTGAGSNAASTLGGLLSSQRPLRIDFSALPDLQEAGNPYGIGNPLSDSGYDRRPNTFTPPAPAAFTPPAPIQARVATPPPFPIPQAPPLPQVTPQATPQATTRPDAPLQASAAPPVAPDVLRSRLQEQQRQLTELLRTGTVTPAEPPAPSAATPYARPQDGPQKERQVLLRELVMVNPKYGYEAPNSFTASPENYNYPFKAKASPDKIARLRQIDSDLRRMSQEKMEKSAQERHDKVSAIEKELGFSEFQEATVVDYNGTRVPGALGQFVFDREGNLQGVNFVDENKRQITLKPKDFDRLELAPQSPNPSRTVVPTPVATATPRPTPSGNTYDSLASMQSASPDFAMPEYVGPSGRTAAPKQNTSSIPDNILASPTFGFYDGKQYKNNDIADKARFMKIAPYMRQFLNANGLDGWVLPMRNYVWVEAGFPGRGVKYYSPDFVLNNIDEVKADVQSIIDDYEKNNPRPIPQTPQYDSLAAQQSPSLPEPSAMMPQYQEAGAGGTRIEGEGQKEPWQMTQAEVRDWYAGNQAHQERNLIPDSVLKSGAYRVATDGTEIYTDDRNYYAKNPDGRTITLGDAGRYWELTLNRLDDIKSGNFDKVWDLSRNNFPKRHHASVEKALSEGKPVPPEVLADYPDLAQRYQKNPSHSATPGKGLTPSPFRVGDRIFHNTTTAVGNRPIRREGTITALDVDKDIDGNSIHRYQYTDKAGREQAGYVSNAMMNEWGAIKAESLSPTPGKGFASRVVDEVGDRTNSPTPAPAPVNKTPESLTRPEKPAQKTAEYAETPLDQQLEPQGKKAIVYTPDNESVPVRWHVMEAGELIPSHDSGFNPRADYEQSLQPRDRSRAATQEQVAEMSARLNPERLSDSASTAEGAPIIGKDKMVESGNGRTMAILTAYEKGGKQAQAYREFVATHADEFGLDTARVRVMKNPVLVRVREGELSAKDRTELASRMGASPVATMSPTEKAQQDARRLISSGALQAYVPNEQGSLNTAPNNDFRSRFLSSLPVSERAEFYKPNGALSPDGEIRLHRGMMAAAYGDGGLLTRLLETGVEENANLARALQAGSGKMSVLRQLAERGEIGPVDISEDVAQAANDFITVSRQRGIQTQEAVKAHLAHQGLFGDDLSPIAQEVLAFFGENNRSGKRMGDLLTTYADLAMATKGASGSLTGERSATAQEILDAAIRRVSGESKSEQPGLFDQSPVSTQAGGRNAVATSQVQPPSTSRPPAKPSSSVVATEPAGKTNADREAPAPGVSKEIEKPAESETAPKPMTFGLPVAGETAAAVRFNVRFVNPKAKTGKSEVLISVWVPKSVLNGSTVTNSRVWDEKMAEVFSKFRERFGQTPGFSDWKIDNHSVGVSSSTPPPAADINEIKERKDALAKAKAEGLLITEANRKRHVLPSDAADKVSRTIAFHEGWLNKNAPGESESVMTPNPNEYPDLVERYSRYAPAEKAKVIVDKKQSSSVSKEIEKSAESETVTDLSSLPPIPQLSASLLRDSHRGTSFDPDRRARMEESDYRRTLERDWEYLSALATTDEARQALREEFDRYAKGYASRVNDSLAAHGRIISVMITGPARFPVARNEKANESYHKKLNEESEFRNKALAAIKRKIAPEPGPIMAGDKGAIDALKTKLESLTKTQESMKVANSIVRRYYEVGGGYGSAEKRAYYSTLKKGKSESDYLAEMQGAGFTESQAKEISNPGTFGELGFAPFSLTNNNANIKRVQQRIAGLEAMKQTGDSEQTWSGGVRVEEDSEDARIRIFFPGKPSPEQISALKSAGMRWSPSNSAWQRQLNGNGQWAVKRVLQGMGYTPEAKTDPVTTEEIDDDIPEAIRTVETEEEIAPQGDTTTKRDQLKAAQAEEADNLKSAVQKAGTRLYSNPLPDPSIVSAAGKWLAYEVAIRGIDTAQAFRNSAEAIRTMADEFGDWVTLHQEKVLESARAFWQSDVVPTLVESKSTVPTWIEGDEALEDGEALSGDGEALGEPEAEPEVHHSQVQERDESGRFVASEQEDTIGLEQDDEFTANAEAVRLRTEATRASRADAQGLSQIGSDTAGVRESVPEQSPKSESAGQPARPEVQSLSPVKTSTAPVNPDARKLLTIGVQQEIAEELGEDITSRDHLKRTWADTFIAAAEDFDALRESATAKALSETPGTLSDEERVVAAQLQKTAREKNRELIDKGNLTPEEQATLAVSIADAVLYGRAIVQTGAEVGRALNFSKALMDDAPGGFMRDVERALAISEGKLSLAQQRALLEVARQGERIQEEVALRLEERAQASIVEAQEQAREAVQEQASKPARYRRTSANPKSDSYGTTNEKYTRERYEEAKKKAREILTGRDSKPGQRGATLLDDAPVELMRALVDIGGFHFEAGIRRYADWAAQVREDIGQSVSDKSLGKVWNKVVNESRKFMTAGEYEAAIDSRLGQMAQTGKAPTSKPRTANPLLDQGVAEYAKGARSLEAFTRGLEKRLGESLPEPMLRELFKEAARKYSVEKGDVQKIKQDLGRKINAALLANRPPLYRMATQILQAKQKIIALKATFDISFFGRQGGKIVVARPSIGAKAISEGLKALRNPGVALALDGEILAEAEVYGGADHWQKIGLDFTLAYGEENTEAGKLDGPLWTWLKEHGIQQSEEANRTILNRLRLDYFKRLAKPGDPVAYQKAMAALVNIMSSRAYMGEGEAKSKVTSIVGVAHDYLQVWSPRNNLSNLQFIGGTALVKPLVGAATMSEPADRAASMRASRRVLGEYARYAATVGTTLAVLAGLAKAFGWDDWLQVDMNPRSKDFGRVRVGKLELDFTSGWRKHWAFLTEVAGARQDSAFDIAARGKDAPPQEWREPDRGRVIDYYTRSMINPLAGEAVTQFKGRDFKGSPVKVYGLQEDKKGTPRPFFDPAQAAVRASLQIGPIGITNWAQAIMEQGALPKETAAWMAVAMPFEFIGLGASVRDRKPESVSKQREKDAEQRKGFTPASEALRKLIAPAKPAGAKSGTIVQPEKEIVRNPVTGAYEFKK